MTWKERCYSDGIPDEVPELLSKSMRVPSYKAIAMAILRNDLNFHSIGFDQKQSDYYFQLKAIHNKQIQSDKKQRDLFDSKEMLNQVTSDQPRS